MEYLGNDKPINGLDPLVSVCVQTYQHAPFIRECLDSILMQETDFPFEIILGEDESTDGTREICIEYAKKHPDKIRLFLRSRKDVMYINGKPTGRFNFIENLKAAKGKYIAICDGDDYWLTDRKLKIQREIIEKEKNAAMVVSSWSSDKGPFSYTDLETSRIAKGIETQRTPGHSSSAFFRKINYFPKHLFRTSAADRALFNYILNDGDAIVVCPPLSYYRIHPNSIFSSKTQEKKNSDHYYDLKIFLRYRKISLREYLKQARGFEKRRSIKLLYAGLLKLLNYKMRISTVILRKIK